MKRQITSFFFCFLPVVLLLSGFFHSVFSTKNLFKSNSQKVEHTIRLKKEFYALAINEIEEEEESIYNSTKIIFTSSFYSTKHLSKTLYLQTKLRSTDCKINVHSLPIWLETNKLII